jgi:hypothetical protein
MTARLSITRTGKREAPHAEGLSSFRLTPEGGRVMQDITAVFGIPCTKDSRAIALHEAGGVAQGRVGDDEFPAHLLSTSWTPAAAACRRAASGPGSPLDSP